MIGFIVAIAVAATIWDGFFRKGWLAKKFGLSKATDGQGTVPRGNSLNVNGIAPASNGISKYEASVKRLSSISSSAEMVEAELTEPPGEI